MTTAVLMVGFAAGPAAAADDFSELLAKVPAPSNTLVMLNAEQIFASQIATDGGWKQNYAATHADSPLLLPPNARHFVLVADLDLVYMQPNWQAAVMRLDEDPSTALIARAIGGQPDTVGGLDAVVTQRDEMIVKFGPNLFGLMHPGSRQTVARWVRQASAGSASRLTPYLQSAADVPDRVGTEIIMAIDLQDALRPDRIRQAIEESPALRDALVDLGPAADVLASLRGATLGVRVTDRVYGKLKVDFGRDVAVLKDAAKPLLLEVLSEAGATIDEFNDWRVQVTDRQIAIDGELTESGMRRLFSFLELDATPVDDPTDGGAMELSGSAAPSEAEASLAYYQAIARHLNDLKHERGAVGYPSIALWFDKYARRIDRLPILGVDQRLVGFGGYVVGGLRDSVEAIKGSSIRSGAQSAQITNSGVGYSYGVARGYNGYAVFGGSGNYGGSAANRAADQVGAVEADRRAIRASERAKSSTDVRAIMREIQEEKSRIRREMTEKYQIEFTDRPARK